MRVLLAAMQCYPGNTVASLRAHELLLDHAARQGCGLAVFPAMSLTGYIDPRVQPEKAVALDSGLVASLVRASAEKGVAALFGIAEANAAGKPFVTQVLANGGEMLGVYRKQHIPPDEEPMFSEGSGGGPFELAGLRFGVAICADIERDTAFENAAAAGAKAVFLCAAPGLYGRREDEAAWRSGFDWWREECLRYLPGRSQRLGITIATATQAGSTPLEDYPGGCMMFDVGDEMVSELPDWRAGALVVELA